jgi:hypothetical protein
MSVKLIHGLQDGVVVKVTDVANGLACRCVCIDCESTLIAVNNPGISCRPHFRHSDAKAKEIKACKASFETAIHYQAKEIIEKKGELSLPEYWVTVSKHTGKGIRKHLVKEQQYVKFDSVINENRVSTSQGTQDIRPDLIGIYKERRLFIEVAVTHQAENEKLESLKRHNVSSIEIDLSKFPRDGNEEDLEKYLYCYAPIKWLYHVQHEILYQLGIEKEQEKAKAYAYYAKKEESERLALEIKNKEKYLERLRFEFCSDLEGNIFKNLYQGCLFERISLFVKLQHSNTISCYRRNGFIWIEHKIDGLDHISCDETYPDDDVFQVECDFIGLSINVLVKVSGCSINELGFVIITNIYHQASLILCDDIENKISINEEDRAVEQKKQDEFWMQLKLEQQAREEEQALKIEQAKLVEIEQAKRDEEARKIKLKEKEIQLAKQSSEEEKLFIAGIKEVLEKNKKNAPWIKDRSVSPRELLNVLKIKMPNIDNQKFIAIRLRLQNNGLLNKVDVNKLGTANI